MESTITVECSRCHLHMGTKPAAGTQSSISHSICESCVDFTLSQLFLVGHRVHDKRRPERKGEIVYKMPSCMLVLWDGERDSVIERPRNLRVIS